MEFKTCEEYVLAELKQAQLEARYWKKRASILAQKLAAYDANAITRPAPMPIKTSDTPDPAAELLGCFRQFRKEADDGQCDK